MSQSFAVTFGGPRGAARALDDLRGWHARRVLLLDDACLAVRTHPDAAPSLHRPRVLERTSLAARLLRRETAPRVALDPARVQRFAAGLEPGTSALVVLVRRIDPTALRAQLPPFLAAHGARLCRLDHAPSAGLGVDEVPTAADLAREALAEQEAALARRLHRGADTRAVQAARHARFMDPSRSAEAIQAVVQRCREAARQGRASTLAYRFPSSVLTDRGRAVHAGDPTWPVTLQGEPKAVHAFIATTLLPKGYAVEAAILDYPDGLLGDVGVVLRWAHLGDA